MTCVQTVALTSSEGPRVALSGRVREEEGSTVEVPGTGRKVDIPLF